MSNPLIKSVILADPSQRVPWPGVPGRLLPPDEPFDAPILHPVWAEMLRDGTLVDAPAALPDKPAKPKS